MMAARAGAEVVHSLEMVPALAAAAKHIVRVNGYADAVTIHGVMSTKLDPMTIGGAFDILVCEIVVRLIWRSNCLIRRSSSGGRRMRCVGLCAAAACLRYCVAACF